ncbi:hypothetical protein YN1HA_9600 [Sulfurisphaera ohwakuensis]
MLGMIMPNFYTENLLLNVLFKLFQSSQGKFYEEDFEN